MAAPVQATRTYRLSLGKKAGNCRIKEHELGALITEVSSALTTELEQEPTVEWVHQYRSYPLLDRLSGQKTASKWYKAHADHEVRASSFELLLRELTARDVSYGKSRRLYHVRVEIVADAYMIQLEIGSPRLPSEGPSHSARLEFTGPDDRLAPIAFTILKSLRKPWDRAMRRSALVSIGAVELLAIPFIGFGLYVGGRLQAEVDRTEVWAQAAGVAFTGLLLGLIPLTLLIYGWRVGTAACVLLSARRVESHKKSLLGGVRAMLDLIPKRWRRLEVAAFIVALLAAVFQLLSWLFPLK